MPGGRRLAALVVLALAAALLAPGLAVANKRAPTYFSHGYSGHKIPKTFVPAKPPAPVALPGSGHDPHVFVDAAGTAHIVFGDPAGTSDDVIRSCRLLRGGRGCSASAALTPHQLAPGNDPQSNQDFDGPFPLAVGNQLLVVDSRCCNRLPYADTFTHNPVYLYTSENAGASFTGPTDANPTAGLIGTQDPSGDAILFGADPPSIGLISDTQTGGTVFQGVPAGSFTTASANLSLRADKQDASDGRLGLDGTRPIAAFSDFSGTIAVREWTGVGSVNDAARWTSLRLTGVDQPRIAGGPKGIALLTEPSITSGILSVRSIAPGGRSAGPPQRLSTAPASSPTLAADPVSGEFVAAWVQNDDDSIHVRTSPDGRTWGPEQVPMRLKDRSLRDLDAAVTADGGGFVVARDPTDAATVYDGRILAAQFGPVTATGRRGLGLVAGGSGPPAGDAAGYVACSQVKFGAVDVQATAGCFLRDPKNPSGGAAVAQSAIRLNGLDIVPDAGVKIYLDPRQHTIDTSGFVRVIAQGEGSSPVTLWHGPVHAKVPDAGAGGTLFDFDMGEFAANVEGFGINAHAKVILAKDGVRIPVDLELPSYFGGITGHADLVVDQKAGLHLDSLEFTVADADIGVLELKDVKVSYRSQGELWDGAATLVIPGPGISAHAHVQFADGAFNEGDFTITVFPGLAVGPDIFLNEVGLGFQLKPAVFSGSVTFGFQPIAPPSTFTIAVRGDFRIEAGPPVVVQISGTGSVVGVPIAHAFFRYSSDGTLRLAADITIGDPDTLGLTGGLKFGIIGKRWGGTIGASVCAFTFCADESVSVNDRGLAVCLTPGSISHDWDDPIYDIETHFGTCVADKYGVPAGFRSARVAARAATRAAGGGTTFAVPAGASAYDVALDGAGGRPRVRLLGPGGSPIAFGDPHAAAAVQTPGTAASKTDYVGLRKPAAGVYTVVPEPGSPAIVGLRVARGYDTPVAHATVGGHGRSRTLRYRVTPVGGVTVRFVERGPAGDAVIGDAKGTHGTLHFRSGAGPGGRRQIVAQMMRDDVPWVAPVIARYTAPPLPRPSAVRHLRATRSGSRLTVRFGPAAHAKRYVVKVLLSDGRGLQRTLKARVRRLVVPKVRRGTRARVTVTATGADGRRGPSRRMTVRR